MPAPRRDGIDDALLSHDALVCYERLLRLGSAPADAAGSTLWPGLDELVAWGLADRAPRGGTLIPVAPGTAIAHLADARARRLEAFVSAAAEQDRVLARLRHEVPDHDVGPSRFATEVVTDTRRIVSLVNELPLRATTEFLVLDDGREEEAILYDFPQSVVERGLSLRTIVPLTEEAKPHFDALLRAAAAVGEEVRLARTVPLRFLVVDSREALVASAGRGLEEAIYTRSGELVTALREVFELIWASARPATATGELSQRERAVLGLLAGGATDTEIARRLGASERTVRRLVAALSEDLGANTRFQLALHAQRAGLIPLA